MLVFVWSLCLRQLENPNKRYHNDKDLTTNSLDYLETLLQTCVTNYFEN